MSKTFIIAEAGVNHNGREDLAVELVDAAARCGADAVKFQTFSADRLVVRGASKAEYQKEGTDEGDQHAMLRALEMSPELHRKLLGRCAERGIEFMSTAFDEESAAFLVDLGIKRIKIPSGEITNEPLLSFLAAQGLPLILSTGMADMAEIKRAVSVITAARPMIDDALAADHFLTILHCTSNYPAALSDINLRAMQTIHEETGLPVGYSDHSLGLFVPIAAVAAGARIIEKHFTLDRDLPGPDHKASLTVDELASMVHKIRDVEIALGSAEKKPRPSELPIRALVRKSVVTSRGVAAGAVITRQDLCVLRPGEGIQPRDLQSVVGRTAARDIPPGTILDWSDFA